MVYNFSVNDRAFNAIKEGRKKFENRVTKVDGDFDYSVIETGDYIKLTNFTGEKMVTKVLYVHWYQSAEELLLVEGCEETLSSTNDFNEGVKALQRFSGYKEGILKNGIFCIRIEPINVLGMKKLLLESLECVTEIDVDKYIYWRDRVANDMVDSAWLGDMSRDDILYLLNNGSRIWMYYHKNNFVCSMMLIPTTEEDLKKFGLADDYLEIVDYGPIMVNSKYRGNGLQKQMIKYLDKYAKEVGYKKAVVTIHPANLLSIDNLVGMGFRFIGKKQFNRGIRNVYLKELNN